MSKIKKWKLEVANLRGVVDIHNVIIAYDDAIPVGDASFKKYDGECAKVKRIFVKQEYRIKGISDKLQKYLNEL